MPRGWYPEADRYRTLNYGDPKGEKNQNRPLFFVDHIMEGYKHVLDAGMAGVGVTFGIGQDGSVSQYTSILDAHWGNGLSGKKALYDRTNTHLAALEKMPGAVWRPTVSGGVRYDYLSKDDINLPNSHSISIEHAGFTGNEWPTQMVEASISVKRWCLEELERIGMPMRFDTNALVGHHQIDGVHRTGCPGSGWPRETMLQALGDESMIRKNGFASRLENRSFVQPKTGFKLDIAKDFKLPSNARQVRLEIFMHSGGLVVRDGNNAYAGQVSHVWDKQHGVVDVFPKDGVILLDFQPKSKVSRIGCLGYVA